MKGVFCFLFVNQMKDKHKIEKVKEDTYLGGIISDECNNAGKLQKAVNKGMGIISVIMAILQEISFGRHYFEIAATLRESLFINGILWNVETWYDMSENDIKELEKIDKILIKRILNVPSSTPSALLYLELGMTPLKYLIQARRLLFLHHIITRKEDTLIYKFFNAQCREPAKNDWSETVKRDMEELDLNYEFSDIKSLSKNVWLKRVKEACKSKAFEDLTDTQMEYSKGNNLGYGSLKMRGYLKTRDINKSQAILLFKIRTRMLNLKNNFKNGNNDLSCKVCFQGVDSQDHMMMECLRLGELINLKEYLSIFGEDEEQMAAVIKKVEKLQMKREEILEA